MDGFGNTKASFVTDEMGVKFDKIGKKGRLVLEIPRLLLRADSYAIRLFASLNSTRTENVLDTCLLYTSDAADERSSVDFGGRRIIKKKKEESVPTSLDQFSNLSTDDWQT